MSSDEFWKDLTTSPPQMAHTHLRKLARRSFLQCYLHGNLHICTLDLTAYRVPANVKLSPNSANYFCNAISEATSVNFTLDLAEASRIPAHLNFSPNSADRWPYLFFLRLLKRRPSNDRRTLPLSRAISPRVATEKPQKADVSHRNDFRRLRYSYLLTWIYMEILARVGCHCSWLFNCL